jgi:uncharacterized protein YraI
MKLHYLAVAGAVAGGLVWSTAAEADVGTATGSVNMRTGPGTAYPVITTIPAGAEVEVLGCPTWCQVVYAGREGWASSNYIATDYADYSPPGVIYEPAPVVRYAYRTPPRAYFRHGRPWWDDRYGYWRDRDPRWYDRGWRHGPGISFEFGW